MKEIFIAFLKKHKAYRAFLINNNHHKKVNSAEEWSKLPPADYLWAAFIWSKTPQGMTYWYDLKDLWEVELLNHDTDEGVETVL